MSETTVGREPVEIIEIITPKCVNVQGTAPCTATETGSDRCFNTRATCTDVDNYQARPAAHLIPDRIYNQGDTVTAADFTRNADFFIKAEVSFPASPDGCIFEVGSSADGAYLGVTAGNLIWRAGDGTPSAAPGTNTGRVSVSAASFAGKTLVLYAEIDFVASGSCQIKLWAFDPIELTLSLLGTDNYTDNASAWAAASDGGVGIIDGTVPNGEDTSDFNGSITSVSVYDSQADPGLDTATDAYRERLYFDDGRRAKPSDALYILPLLTGTRAVGTRLNVGGSDTRYETLGRRAFLAVNFADAPHSDFYVDPYLSGRTYEPLSNSTFWRKWLLRNKFGRTRGLVRRYSGYADQALSAMRRQTYVVDKFDLQGDRVSLSCRDYLSLTEFRRAQVPAPTNGKLDADLTDVATTMALVGDVTDEYPATGTVRIDDELIQYTGRTYAALGDQTTFTGLTRASDGSTAAEHDADESVQLCKRYAAARIDDVLEGLLVNDAAVPAQIVDLAGFTSVYDTSLAAYTLTTVISEPTGVDQLIGEMAEQCSFYIWWDERAQLIKMQAIEALATVDATFRQDTDIVSESFTLTERPKERLTTLSYYYNPRNFAGDLSKPANYKNQLVVSNSRASGPDQYGTLPQTREVFSRWLTTEAQANQTGSRYSVRYAGVPSYASFLVDAKDRQYWVGDFVQIEHDYLIDKTGALDPGRRWLIVEAEEVEAGHSQRLTCVDVTLDGLIYYITANGIGNYTAALFAAQNAFITDNNGLNPDGTDGATIS